MRLAGLVGLVVLLLGPAQAQAGTPLDAVEAEFREAIRRVRPASVVCVPWGVAREQAGFSSGVLISPDGLVLSDGDVGLRQRVENGREISTWLSDVEVRVPVSTGRFSTYRAQVLSRDRQADTSLLRIVGRPARDLPFVKLGLSDSVRVGEFAFMLGTAFDEDGRAPPTSSAGTIAAMDPLEAGDAGGRYAFLYVTSGVNRGVNGGPVVDLSGRLVGTVSTWVEPEPDAPHQFLGKVVPINRLRAVHAGVSAARSAFAAPVPTPRTSWARSLEIAFAAAGAKARPAVLSLEVVRSAPVANRSPFDRRDTRVQRWRGPVSGLAVTSDGWIVTSLYNLTNVGTLVEPLWRVPEGAELEQGLRDVRSVTVFLPQGGRAPARVVGHDRRLGIALLKADLPAGRRLTVLEPAPPEAFEAGRFVLAIGNPYGGQRREQPLLTTGMLSRHHPVDAAAPWRGQWQTDAAVLDGNAGGAAVDLEGRLYGMFTLWYPARHGRNSGVAFVVPWERIQESLPALREGHGPTPGFLGVRFAPGRAARLESVLAGTAAARAGLRAGDVIHRIDREVTDTVEDVVVVIGFRCSGDLVDVTVERDGSLLTIPVALGTRED